MSNRTILSRPRTRLYDANYNIGESYYKSALDSIDRKYSGRPAASPSRQTSLPRDLLERHDRAFADEDLTTSRRRAEKHITESHLFDSRGGRIAANALNALANDISEETASALTRIRANKKVSILDDVDLDSTISSISSKRMIDRSEKLLDTVGINQKSRRALDEDIAFKSRSLKVSYDNDGGDLTKWSPIGREEGRESAAAMRAKQSRDRLLDIEQEMAATAEKQAARERRAARVKAFVAENAAENEATQLASQSVRISKRREKQTVEF